MMYTNQNLRRWVLFPSGPAFFLEDPIGWLYAAISSVLVLPLQRTLNNPNFRYPVSGTAGRVG